MKDIGEILAKYLKSLEAPFLILTLNIMKNHVLINFLSFRLWIVTIPIFQNHLFRWKNWIEKG
jgi:hypothetical protein